MLDTIPSAAGAGGVLLNPHPKVTWDFLEEQDTRVGSKSGEQTRTLPIMFVAANPILKYSVYI